METGKIGKIIWGKMIEKTTAGFGKIIWDKIIGKERVGRVRKDAN